MKYAQYDSGPTSRPPVWRVLVVHEHGIVRDGLQCLLERAPNIDVIGQAKDGWIAVDFCREHKPDIVVMPVSLSGLNAFETTRHILEYAPATRVIGLSKAGEERLAGQFIRSGAHRYGLMEDGVDELMAVLQSTVGSPAASEPVADGDTGVVSLSRLTSREVQVLTMIADGYSARDIAEQLELSRKTIDNHRRSLMDKLQVSSVAGLTKYAVRQGLSQL